MGIEAAMRQRFCSSWAAMSTPQQSTRKSVSVAKFKMGRDLQVKSVAASSSAYTTRMMLKAVADRPKPRSTQMPILVRLSICTFHRMMTGRDVIVRSRVL